VQVDAFDSEYVPAKQCVELAKPVELHCDPAGQIVHTLALAVSTNDPAAHKVHAVDPDRLYEPAAHVVMLVEEQAEPAGHCVHDVEPDAKLYQPAVHVLSIQ
jgi:hypothetical protein